MLIYISGPITAPTDEEIKENILRAEDVMVVLLNMGHSVICPHKNTYDLGHMKNRVNLTHAQWIEMDKQQICICSAMVVLHGWKNSDGSKLEVEYAEKLGIPIYFLQENWESEAEPNLPALHLTEVRCPNQSRAFMEILGDMYRTHLDKNADYCLAPGTRVLTGDLVWVPIEDLHAGMVIVGFDEKVAEGTTQKRRMYRPSTVEFVGRVTLPSYRLVLENGDEFIASGEHPWLVSRGLTGGWLNTENIHSKETYPQQHTRLIKAMDVWEPSKDYESGYLAAAIDGEGWLSQSAPTGKNRNKHGKSFMLGFAQTQNAMLEYVVHLLDEMEIPYRIKTTQGIRQALHQLIFSKPRRDVIRFLGTVRPKRIISNLNQNLGMVDLRRRISVVKKEFIGDQELIALRTSTRTFLANGYATHNSPANILGTGEIGLVTRLWDKMARLFSLTGFNVDVQFVSYGSPKKPKNESVEDGYRDMSVYGVIGRLLRAGKWGR